MNLSDRLKQAKRSDSFTGTMPGMMDFSFDDSHDKVDEFEDLKKLIHRDVIDVYNKKIQENQGDKEGIDVKSIIENLIATRGEVLTKVKRDKIVQEIYDDVMGLGPLEQLLRDDDISEVMVNGPKQIYIERKGKIELSGVFFRDDDHVMQIINRIVSPLGRRCDEANPMVDARLEDGSRVNAIVPPVALNGPTITIRKFNSTPLQIKDLIGFNSTPLQIKDLIGFNSISFQMASFLEAAVKGRCNIMVSGGTGSGKTTLLNVLSSFIPETERIVTVEDAAELQMMQDHVITLEARPANVEGKGAVPIRDLVKNCLRMRPDRIIVGEIRSGEALDMLQAMNTGHDGSLSTAHANTPRDMIARLETMVMMAGMDLPVKAIREQIASAIDLVVQQTRFRDGSRKVVAISEVTGMEGDTVTLQDIFVFKPDGYDAAGKLKGKFEPTGIRPYVLDTLMDNGVAVQDDWFVK